MPTLESNTGLPGASSFAFTANSQQQQGENRGLPSNVRGVLPALNPSYDEDNGNPPTAPAPTPRSAKFDFSSLMDDISTPRSRFDSIGSIHSAASERGSKRKRNIEMDPYYAGNFGFSQYPIVFNVYVLGCVSRRNPIRVACIACVRTTWFEGIILLLIVVNSILMALYDPVAVMANIPSSLNDVIASLEWFFQIAFTLEAFIKIVAQGLWSRPSGYFREAWNWLDFVIVVVGWVPLVVEVLSPDSPTGASSSLTVIRSIRILRPLRTLHFFPALKNLVKTILGAAKAIGSVMLLCCSILLIFAMVGVTLFKGNLRQRCGILVSDDSWLIPEDELEAHCSLSGAFGRNCPDGLECIVTDFNPNLGLQSFDNIGVALLTVFQVITEEGWSSIMYGLFDTTYEFIGIYFILLVLFGSYFMINLLISALSVNYMQVRKAKDEADELDEERESFMDSLVREAEYKAEMTARFLKLTAEKQVQQMEMRLMYSYEKHNKEPYYTLVSKDMFDQYYQRNRAVYPKWKKRLERKLSKKSRKRIMSTKQHRIQNLVPINLEDDGTSTNSTGGSSRTIHAGSDGFLESMQSMHKIYKNYHEEQELEMIDIKPALGKETGGSEQLVSTIAAPSRGSDAGFYEAREVMEDDQEIVDVHQDESMLNFADRSADNDNSSKKKRIRPVPVGQLETARPSQRWVYETIVSKEWFRFAVMIVIGINTVILASEHFGQPEWMFAFLEYSNYVFLAVFTLEIGLRLYGEGPAHYFFSWFNRFDSFVVFMGYVELFLSGSDVASVFRLLRILRFFRLVNYWPTFSNLVESVNVTIKQLFPFLIFFSLFLYIFTISGLYLLGGRLSVSPTVEVGGFRGPGDEWTNQTVVDNLNYDCTSQNFDVYIVEQNSNRSVLYCPERANYDNFLWSLVTNFQVISGEDWNSVMFLVVESTGSYWFVLYYMFLVLFGTYVVLNFFLAILIDTFVEQHEIREEKKKAEKQKEKVERVLSRRTFYWSPVSFRRSKSSEATTDEDDVAFHSGTNDSFRRGSSRKNSSLKDVLEKKQKEKHYDLTLEEILELEAFQTNSVFVITPTNRWRLKVAELVHKTWFDAFILLVIFFSCILLALDSPTRQVISPNTMWILNVLVVVVFGIEAALKIFAFGFVRHKGTYLRNAWNVLDFFILIISIVDVSVPDAKETGALQALRALRALRPLRAVHKLEGLRIVVTSFTMAIVPCLQVMILCIISYAIFSICSVTFFQGAIHACYACPVGNTTTPGVDDGIPDGPCIRNVTEMARMCYIFPSYEQSLDCPSDDICTGYGVDPESGIAVQYMWLNPTYGGLYERWSHSRPYSFDNFLISFQTLFEISTMEIWMEPMYIVSDAVGIGKSPVRGSNDYSSIFFMVFLFALQFFMLQVFVAVLIDTYFDSTSAEKGDAFMTGDQKKWVDFNRKALMKQFKPHSFLSQPDGRVRRFCYRLVLTEQFKVFIYTVIILNSLWLLTDHYDQSEMYAIVFEVLDYLFGSIYVIEAVLKIVGFGFKGYFKRKSNWFDFIIVLSVLIGWMLNAFVHNPHLAAPFKAIEALRVFRVFRLLKLAPGLKPLLATLLLTLYPLLNILTLILLVIFIYAVLGMQLFGEISPDDETKQFVTEYVNFQTFPNAFFTLFVISTGESWNGIMHDLAFESAGAVAFCISFVILSQLFLLNLFVAVILANFTQQFENSKKRKGVKENVDENSLKHYNLEWNAVHYGYVEELRRLVDVNKRRPEEKEKYEAQLSHALLHPSFLPARKFPDLILRLKAPLGFRKRSNKAHFTSLHVMKYVKDRHIPVTASGEIHFHATLRALIDINVLQGQVPDEVEKFLQLKLSAYTRGIKMNNAAGLRSNRNGEENGEAPNMVNILASEQLRQLIRRYTVLWKVRQLRKHGASDESIRRFLEEYNGHSMTEEVAKDDEGSSDDYIVDDRVVRSPVESGTDVTIV